MGNGTHCVDFNECSTNPCHVKATCDNNIGSYSCRCIQGYTGNGTYCMEINECLSNPCHTNATCAYGFMSYNCTCKTGFTGNGTVCLDVNECLTSPCHKNATCHNNIGSFICDCNPGFSGNGIECRGTIRVQPTFLIIIKAFKNMIGPLFGICFKLYKPLRIFFLTFQNILYFFKLLS